MRCIVALFWRRRQGFCVWSGALTRRGPCVSTMGEIPAGHVPLRPGHTPRICAAYLLLGPTYFLGDVSFGYREWSCTGAPRGSSVSATSAPPRSMRLRVVGPQFTIPGLAYPHGDYRARAPHSPHGALGYSNRHPIALYTNIGRDFVVYSSHVPISGIHPLPAKKTGPLPDCVSFPITAGISA